MLLHFGFAKAQQYDNIWLFGYDSNPINLQWGGSTIEFIEDTIDVYYEFREMWINKTNASICDSDGNLQFYTNGIYIANTLGEPMENGDGLNPCEYTDNNYFLGHRVGQGALALPNPDGSNSYYLFHKPLEYPSDQLDWHSPFLYNTLIDMDAENGLGAVVYKNIIVVDDLLEKGLITAVKHGNGRDWWLLNWQFNSNCYYKLLISPEGIGNHGLNCLGEQISGGVGQAVFSPDGSRYCYYNGVNINTGNELAIYNFDRCTGELSNPIHDILIDSAWTMGAAISPNSRYLYVSSYNYIYQYDLQAENVLNSKDTVAIYDGHYEEIEGDLNGSKLYTRFSLMQLGPDGKIYVACPGAVDVLHVINRPDSAGIACEVLQHHIALPTFNNSSMPNFPNYRLGPLEGSDCILSNSEELTSENNLEISIYPNPTNDLLNISFSKLYTENIQLELFSIEGKLLNSIEISQDSNDFQFDLSDFPQGIYLCKISTRNGESLTSEKITISR